MILLRMLLNVRKEIKISSNGRRRPHTVVDLKCDICLTIFSVRNNVKKLQQKTTHFCSASCSHSALRKDGISNKKMRNTCLDRYGVVSVMQNEFIKQKYEQTCLSVYGTKSPLQNAEIYSKRETTSISRYGVSSFFQIKNFSAIRIASMKRNGTSFNSSRPEVAFFENIVCIWPRAERHIIINDLSIDVFVPEISLFIQFDGDFFHGLKPCGNSDKFRQNIESTINRDKRQNEWFVANGLNLCRVQETLFLKRQSITNIDDILSICHFQTPNLKEVCGVY